MHIYIYNDLDHRVDVSPPLRIGTITRIRFCV